MKWINAEQKVTVTIYDEEHEEHLDKIMTVEEMLDTYTNEGCPTIYSNPEQKMERWIPVSEWLPEVGSEVLVCFDFKGNRSVYISHFYGDGEFHGLDDEYLTSEGRKYRKAVAWMPLPEPYKKEGE